MRQSRFYAPMFVSKEQDGILDEMVRRSGSRGRNGVAVFDLDGCLFDNRPRIIRIFRELASRHGEADLYRVRPEHFADWKQDDTMRRAGIADSRVAALHPAVLKQFFQQFFSSDFCLYDHAMPGAARHVWDCYRAGAQVVYLTGRHDEMRPGTEKALGDWGFPYHRSRTTLITKADLTVVDEHFKEEAIREIELLGEPVLFVDNEPANVNVFCDARPDAMTVWVQSDHSPRPIGVRAEVPGIRGFLRTGQPGAESSLPVS